MNFVVEIRHCLIVTLITVLGGQTVAAQTKDGKAETIEKSFNRKTTISRWVNASPMEVWRVLTEAENYPNWNSNIISIAGNIALDQKIKLRTTLDSSRTFTLKIKEFQPNALLKWCNSKGIRTFVLKEKNGGTSITMTEKIGGLMYPLYAKYLPSFNDSFEIFMSDLKKIVETK
ncbi:MAG: SRPBCC domain-containing protein [Bacteroidota bacterium]